MTTLLALTFTLGADPAEVNEPPIDFAKLTLREAKQLKDQSVLATLKVGWLLPPGPRTVCCPEGCVDDVSRCVLLEDGQDIKIGKRITVAGRLRVIYTLPGPQIALMPTVRMP
jgi:hypothetical protein